MHHLKRVAAFCAIGFGLLGGTLRAQTTDSEHVTKLLAQARTQSAAAAEDAQKLKNYAMSSMSWQSHTIQVGHMRDDVNALGKTVKELNDAKAEGSQWQQIAIDRVNPMLQDMADTLTGTIQHMNEHSGQIHSQEYRDYTAANYDLADRTSTVIRDFLDYGKARARVTELEHKLELPSTTSGG